MSRKNTCFRAETENPSEERSFLISRGVSIQDMDSGKVNQESMMVEKVRAKDGNSNKG